MSRKPQAKWRQLERLVAQIEQGVGAIGLKVTSPGRLEDKDTGEDRFVDVLLESITGSVPVRIIVECRRHRRRQGVQWIEEIYAKKRSTGSDVAVAVSTSGFSKNAERKARNLGIQLRTIAEIGPDNLPSWCGGGRMHAEFSTIWLTDLKFTFAEDVMDVVRKIVPECVDPQDPVRTAVLRTVHSRTETTPLELWAREWGIRQQSLSRMHEARKTVPLELLFDLREELVFLRADLCSPRVLYLLLKGRSELERVEGRVIQVAKYSDVGGTEMSESVVLSATSTAHPIEKVELGLHKTTGGIRITIGRIDRE